MCVYMSVCVCVCVCVHALRLSDSLQPHGLWPTRILWNFPGKHTGVGCHVLLQGIVLTQESNLYLLHCKWILYHWATCKALCL